MGLHLPRDMTMIIINKHQMRQGNRVRLLRYTFGPHVGSLGRDKRVPLREKDDCWSGWVSWIHFIQYCKGRKEERKKRTPHQIARYEGEDQRAAPESDEKKCQYIYSIPFRSFGCKAGKRVGETHVRLSPLGLRNHAASEAPTMITRPMTRLQL